jgi:hypothetical protein
MIGREQPLERDGEKEREHQPCMKRSIAANQTLQSPFPLLCKTVSCGQPNEVKMLIFGSYLPSWLPNASPPRAKKGLRPTNHALNKLGNVSRHYQKLMPFSYS